MSRPGPIRVGAALSAVLLTVAVGVVAAAAPEAPADAGRGRRAFAAKGCARCHRPRAEGQGMGPSLELVRRPQGVFELAGRLWNHAPSMAAAATREGVPWPSLSREEMADLMAYLEADPRRDPTPNPLQGQLVLVRKGCLKCHRLRGEGGHEAPDLTMYRDDYESPLTWATTVWSHSPRMAGHAERLGVLYPRFADTEMGDVVGYLRSLSGAPGR